MWTNEKIQKFIAEYGFNPYSTKKEIKNLPSILHNDEDLLGIIQGDLKLDGKNSNGLGLFIVTSKRFIFYRKSIIGTERKEEYPLNRVSSSSYRSGIINGSITIYSSNNEAVIGYLNKSEATKLDSIIQNLLNKKIPNNAQELTTQPIDYLSQIEKLFELKEKGILTESEFLEQKEKLLKV